MPWIYFCPDPCTGQIKASDKAPKGGGACAKCSRIFDSPQAIIAAGGGSAHLCVGRQPRRYCQTPECRRDCAALCDFPLKTPGKSCSRRMCEAHRTKVGDNVDVCPAHVAAYREAFGDAG